VISPALSFVLHIRYWLHIIDLSIFINRLYSESTKTLLPTPDIYTLISMMHNLKASSFQNKVSIFDSSDVNRVGGKRGSIFDTHHFVLSCICVLTNDTLSAALSLCLSLNRYSPISLEHAPCLPVLCPPSSQCIRPSGICSRSSRNEHSNQSTLLQRQSQY
jgi:hypothetical protein